jgi:hypothetical protein
MCLQAQSALWLVLKLSIFGLSLEEIYFSGASASIYSH